MNFVFASTPSGGAVRTSARHPEVAYFSRAEIADLSRRRRLRGTHIERALDAFEAGIDFPLSLVHVVEASQLPVAET